MSGLVQILIVAVTVISLRFFSNSTKYPRVGNSRLWTWLPKATPMRYELDKVAGNGYTEINKRLGKTFVMKFFGFDYLMLPPKYLQDLKKAAADALSFNVSFSDAFNLSASVGNLYFTENMAHAVTKYLNKQLRTIVPALVDEVDYALSLETGRPTEWKQVVAAQLNGALIHRVTNRVIVGPTLSRDERFSRTSLAFTSTLLPSAVWTNFTTFGPLRALASRLTTFFHKRELEATLKLLLPEIEKRLASQGAGDEEDPNDSIQWLIEIAQQADDPREMAPRRIAENVLHLLFAANSAPGALVTQMVYEALMTPAYLEALRAEVDAVVGAGGGGAWTAAAVDEMPLLDSFVRETLRVYPPGSIACTRTVMGERYTLHDGMALPVGSRVAFPVLAIQTDPENYEDARRFDGYRFVKADEGTGKLTSLVSSSTITTSFLPFGYGKHACPGRFFGILEAKLVFGKLLQEYDLEWAKPVESRPPNVSIEGMVPPNQEAVVKIKLRGN